MDYRVEKVISLMEADLRRELSLAEMATAVNLSPSRLRHMFRDEVGMTPTRYLQSLRLERARELVETTFMRVKEVGYAVGVNGESHFVRDFKQAFGQSPARHRAGVAGLLSGGPGLTPALSHFRQ